MDKSCAFSAGFLLHIEWHCQPMGGSCTTLFQYWAVLSNLRVAFFMCGEQCAVLVFSECHVLPVSGEVCQNLSAEEVEKCNLGFTWDLSVSGALYRCQAAGGRETSSSVSPTWSDLLTKWILGGGFEHCFCSNFRMGFAVLNKKNYYCLDLQTQFSSAQGHSHRAGDGGICQGVRGEVRHWLRLALAVGIKWICHLWINSKDFHASEKTLFLHSFLMLQEIRHFHI